ncbi:MAG: HAD hydrolase-like protein [Microscillaceae bacterium]|jgi:phosphonatase-like hydrolase|nr:HAD hydrolase-like protein [Microscillaceae bacterium]
MIQLVVFDMAGTTLHDSQNVHQALQDALAEFGFSFSLTEINPWMGVPKPLAIRELLNKYVSQEPAISEELIEQIHQSFLVKMIHFYQTDASVRERDKASEVFAHLRANGIKVALDTGFSRDIANTIITRLGWQDKIDGSVTSDEVAQGRPYPDMIFKAMQLTQITDIEAVVKVGDTFVDVQQGKNAGCKYVIGITGGSSSTQELQAESPSYLINDLREMVAIIQAINEWIFEKASPIMLD